MFYILLYLTGANKKWNAGEKENVDRARARARATLEAGRARA